MRTPASWVSAASQLSCLLPPPVLAPLLCASEPCSEDAVPVPPLSVLMADDVTLESIGRCQCPYHVVYTSVWAVLAAPLGLG